MFLPSTCLLVSALLSVAPDLFLVVVDFDEFFVILSLLLPLPVRFSVVRFDP